MANGLKLAKFVDEQRHSAIQAGKSPFDLARNPLSGAWRLATQWVRHLPTTVIVGAQDAGATQLYASMVEHPRCFGSAETELDFLSKYPRRPVAWYRSQFPWQRRVWRRQGHVIEASPSYLGTPSALRKMHIVVPNARVIVILCDPVSRAFSHYHHNKMLYLEPRSFAEAVEEEIHAKAFPAQWGVALGDGAKPMSEYVALGYYALQMELLGKLYRRNRILVLDSANLFADPAATCNRVFDYMGLEECDPLPSEVYDGGFFQENIEPRVAERLRQHYRPYDEMLQELLGQSFSWMLPPVQSLAA